MIHSIDSFPGRTILSNGKSYLYFGGTSYLGLQTDVKFQNLFIKNLKKYGTNYGASRKANLQISVFEKAEHYLSNLVGSESCVTMSSGYLAGQLVAQTLNTPENQFFYAPEMHSAVHILSKKQFNSFDELIAAVEFHLKANKSTPVVFMDSITISNGAYPEFEALKKLPLKEILLVVDDSHGIGIVGENGSGVFKAIKKLHPKELIVCCSLGKGFGIQAGAIFGTKSRIEQFENTEFYGGASPAAPAALATLFDAAAIFKEKRQLLSQNIQFFLDQLENHELLDFQENYPAFYFSNPEITSYLEKNSILITSFNYPKEDSEFISRIVLSAAHTKEDIRELTRLLNSL